MSTHEATEIATRIVRRRLRRVSEWLRETIERERPMGSLSDIQVARFQALSDVVDALEEAADE